jgi:hypothetical protein
MENIHCNSDVYEMEKTAELEHIEYLITGGADPAEILEMFPQHSKEIIDKIVDSVSWFCFMSDDEAATRTIGDKEYIVKSVFLGEKDRDINTAILNLAERKAIQEMGLEMPLNTRLFDNFD